MSVTSVTEKWVDEAAALTRPSRVVWCDGSKIEYDALVEEMLRDGTLLPLNPTTYPNCYLHRSHPQDVARTEQLTFICTCERDDAGLTNNWMAPAEAKARAGGFLRGAMLGRPMYVIPYLMGPAGSSMSRVGLMVTDSAYVVASMHIMTRVGPVALQHMRSEDDVVFGLHSLGDLSPDRRLILHFPEEKLIWSVGSGYGGNALLGKKCHSLRIGSWQARREGWLPEHMFIIGVEDPEGRGTYLAAAQPNSRFTVLAQQCPSMAPNWEDPQGVPISGLIFGSRRSQVIPLVFEAFDWTHGVFLGSAMSTETTAAITGKVGVVRRDPMAMLPFCGYNMADYFAHWLAVAMGQGPGWDAGRLRGLTTTWAGWGGGGRLGTGGMVAGALGARVLPAHPWGGVSGGAVEAPSDVTRGRRRYGGAETRRPWF